jgi:hypothetical protein
MPIEIVITGLDPVIHLLRKNLLRKLMDARIKSGHDEGEGVSRGMTARGVARSYAMNCHGFNFQKAISDMNPRLAALCFRAVHAGLVICR